MSLGCGPCSRSRCGSYSTRTEPRSSGCSPRIRSPSAQVAERIGGPRARLASRRPPVRLRRPPAHRLRVVVRRAGDPARGRPHAVAAFADLLSGWPRVCASLVGPADGVLEPVGAAVPAAGVRIGRSATISRCCCSTGSAATATDPLVRPVRPDEVDLLFPASVAMYTEEVGVSPVGDDGGRGYRATGRRAGAGRPGLREGGRRPGGLQGRAGRGDPAYRAVAGGLDPSAVARAGHRRRRGWRPWCATRCGVSRRR